MSDSASDSAADISSATQAKNDKETSPLASILLKLWNLVMLISTAVLSFYLFVLKDNSVIPFVILGIIGLLIPPIVGLFRSMARNKRLRIEREKRLQEAQLERIRQAREREAERQQMEKLFAADEAAMQQAVRSIDTSVNKPQ